MVMQCKVDSVRSKYVCVDCVCGNSMLVLKSELFGFVVCDCCGGTIPVLGVI